MKTTTRTVLLATALGCGVLAVGLFPRASRHRNTEIPAAKAAGSSSAIPGTTSSPATPAAHTMPQVTEIATTPAEPITAEGRSLFASLGEIVKESRVSLPIPGGSSLPGKVAYTHHHPNGAVTVGGMLEDGSGTFELAREPWGPRGFILQRGLGASYEYSNDAAGNLQVVHGPAGRIICDPPEKSDTREAGAGGGGNTEAEVISKDGESVGVTSVPVPILNSRPSASAVLYLDMDGQIVEGSGWNGNTPRIVARSKNWTETKMTETWQAVAEDYASFDINVTTDLQTYLRAPEGRRMRCVICQSAGTPSEGSNGVAFIGSFGWSGDPVCWIGSDDPRTISHESGHTFGLGHDGRTAHDDVAAESYYYGHSRWTPILGGSSFREFSQWSKGSYLFADNPQDDLAVIAEKLAYVPDDHSDLTATATPLTIGAGGAVTSSGVIQNQNDIDTFEFSTAGGNTTLNFSRLKKNISNLVFSAKLYDSAGTLLATADSTNQNEAANVPISLNLAAGVYSVKVDGIGVGTWETDGFDDYGSLGQYSITGTVASPGWRFRIPVSALAGAAVGTVSPGTGSAYSITGGNTGGAFAINAAGNLTVANRAALANQQLFTLTVNHTIGGSPVASTVPVSIAPERGQLRREIYAGITGTTVANLTAHASYPNAPTSTGVLDSFEAPAGVADNFGERVSGYILPPTSGNYQFWIASDDASELWLSSGADPANKVKIAYLNGYSGARNWTADATQASAPIALVAGQHYYIEALHKEGGSADHLAVAWQGPGIAQSVIGSGYLAYPGARPNRAPQLASSTFRVLDSATIGTTVGTLVSGDPDPGSVLTFAITGGNPGNAFAVNAATGVITVNAALDFSARPTHAITVQATDPGGLTATAEILVEVNAPALKREIYTAITGFTIADLTASASYPNSPTTVEYRQTLETPSGAGDNYGQRLSGYLRAPDTGNYTFWIAGDDATELWLSTDASPANKSKIAYNATWTDSRQWFKNSTQASVTIPLQGGKFYYLEALMKEATGGDHLAVSWAGPGFNQVLLGAPYVTQKTYNHSGPVLDDSTITIAGLNPSITTVNGKDWGDPGTTVTYAITAGNGAGYFAIDALTGEITTTVSLVPTGSYVLTVSGTDNAPAPLSDTATLTVNIARPTLKRETWTGIQGTAITDLTGSAAYAGAPNKTFYLKDAEYANLGGDNYGTRTSGWFTAPASGSYFFYVASDDASELWISTNGNPANKILRSSVSGYTNPKAWTAIASQKSAAVILTAGTSYYLETLHKEGGGGDHLAIGWQSAAGGAITDLPAANLSITRPNQLPLAVNDSATTNEGSAVTVNVLANDSDPDGWPSALAITDVGTTASGSVVRNGSSVVYTPAAGFYGTASFDYTIGDGSATTTATVSVTVTDNSTAHDLTGGGLTRSNLGGAGGLSRVLAGGDWEMVSTGAGLTGTSDAAAYESAVQAGHFDVVLRLKSLTGPAGARAGLMLREGTGDSDRFVAVGLTSSGSFYHASRTAAGGQVVETAIGSPVPVLPDAWVMLRRAGDRVRIHVSGNGSTFQEVAAVTVTGLASSLRTGPYTTSGGSGTSARAVLAGYGVTFALPASAFAWWELDENTGTTAIDAFGTRNLTLTNSPAWKATPRNYGISFDGTNDYLNLASADVPGNWSAAMWVKRTGTKASSALMASTGYCLKLEQSNTTKVGITKFGVADYLFNYPSPLNSWVHLVFVGSTTQTKLYVNGVLTDTLNVPVSLPMQDVGRRPTSQDLLQAELDDLILFGSALSDAEVTSLYQEMQ